MGSGYRAGQSRFPWRMNCPTGLSFLMPGSGLQFLAGTCCSLPGKRSKVWGGGRKQASTPPRVGQARQGTATCLKHTVTQAGSQGCRARTRAGGGGGWCRGKGGWAPSGWLFPHWQNRSCSPRSDAAGLIPGSHLS